MKRFYSLQPSFQIASKKTPQAIDNVRIVIEYQKALRILEIRAFTNENMHGSFFNLFNKVRMRVNGLDVPLDKGFYNSAIEFLEIKSRFGDGNASSCCLALAREVENMTGRPFSPATLRRAMNATAVEAFSLIGKRDFNGLSICSDNYQSFLKLMGSYSYPVNSDDLDTLIRIDSHLSFDKAFSILQSFEQYKLEIRSESVSALLRGLIVNRDADSVRSDLSKLFKFLLSKRVNLKPEHLAILDSKKYLPEFLSIYPVQMYPENPLSVLDIRNILSRGRGDGDEGGTGGDSKNENKNRLLIEKMIEKIECDGIDVLLEAGKTRKTCMNAQKHRKKETNTKMTYLFK